MMMMMMMMMMAAADAGERCSKVNFADAPPDNLVNAVLGSCHIADPTPPPPSPPTDGATFPLPTIPTGAPCPPSVCLFVCLSVCLSVCPSVCPSVRLSVCLSVCLSVRLSVCLSDHWPVT